MTDQLPAPVPTAAPAWPDLIEAHRQRPLRLRTPERTAGAFGWEGDLLVAAAEALHGSDDVEVDAGSARLRAEVLACDLRTDVAVLRAAGLTGPASAPEASEPRLGESFALLGRSEEGVTADIGHVRLAGPAWTSRRGGRISARLELGVRLRASTEGALVLDASGHAIGMAVPGPGRSVLAIPTATIAAVVAQVRSGQRMPQPYLGLRLWPLPLSPADRQRLGVPGPSVALVAGVESGSSAAAVGLEIGDLLLAADGRPLESAAALLERIGQVGAGGALSLRRRRGTAVDELVVRIGEHPRASAS